MFVGVIPRSLVLRSIFYSWILKYRNWPIEPRIKLELSIFFFLFFLALFSLFLFFFVFFLVVVVHGHCLMKFLISAAAKLPLDHIITFRPALLTHWHISYPECHKSSCHSPKSCLLIKNECNFRKKTVNKIMIQGRTNWYDWVTGFHLYFSDDGHQWTGYSQSGDKNHANVCCLFIL